jgi:UPF0755 protein
MSRRPLLWTSLALIVAGSAAAILLYWSLLRNLDNRPVEFEVPAGSSATQVLELLADHGLLSSPLAGRLYLLLWGADRQFRFGHYEVPARVRPIDVLEQILEGQVETVTVTVVEGTDSSTIAQLCVDAGIGTPDEWQGALIQTSWIEDLSPAASSLEGYLFPDTYRFAIGLDAAAAAHHMVDRFRDVWRPLANTSGQLWGSPHEVVILASLVEAETSVADERPRIAGVFLNRLNRGMLLQCDPTVVYALKRQGLWQGRLLRRHLQLDDTYNTYRYPGLPPGPINSPGEPALAAVLDPEAHSYLYFVARPGGGHTFSRSLADHNRAVAELRRSRR